MHGSGPQGLFQRWVAQAGRAVPSQCAVCHAWPALRICAACVARYAQPRPRCLRCALAVPDGVEVCGACVREPPALDTCRAAVDYSYPWPGIVGDLKFRHDPGWATVLAGLMRSAPWVEPTLEQADLVVPVPLARLRLRERGFNQAALLAHALAPQQVAPQMLLRLRDTDAQSGLPRAQRLRNLRGAFVAEPMQRDALRGRSVVLVDDVMTTGATLEAAARVLRECGAARVSGVVLARTAID